VLEFNEGESRRIEVTYMTPDVIEQRRLVVEALGLRPGERVLDIGSGPGLLTSDLAGAVGPSSTVHGVEPSEAMLAMARGRERAPGSAPVEYVLGDAGDIPFPDGTFDAATATQVYEYVPDIPQALAEARRVLRPGGRLLVLDTDWGSIVWHSTDPARMRRMLAAWDEHLADPYLPRTLGALMAEAGFAVRKPIVIPLLNAGYDENTYSHHLIGFVSAFVVGRQGITRDEASAWADDLVSLGPEYLFSLNRYLFVATRL
jgi:SAM-dependent methyltransferase